MVPSHIRDARETCFKEFWFLLGLFESFKDVGPIFFDSNSKIFFEARGSSTEHIDSFCLDTIESKMIIDDSEYEIFDFNFGGRISR